MPKDRLWRLTNLAVADLDEIWSHTVMRWSVAQADQYHNDILDMIADLAADRRRGRAIVVNARNYLSCPSGSHPIFFREEKTRIVIVRIVHQRMDFKRHL